MRRKVEDYQKVHDFNFSGIYRGVVEDNNPTNPKTNEPYKDGRVRVRIWGLHTKNKTKEMYDGIPTNELPLALPALGLLEGSVTGFGTWVVPKNGSHVFVFFEHGNHMRPIYFASAPGIPKHKADPTLGFNDPNTDTNIKSLPKENRLEEPDYHRLARGESDTTVITEREDSLVTGIETAGGSWDEPEPTYGAQYPENVVIATKGGIVIEIDSTADNQRIHIYHPSKSYIEINKDGDLSIKATGSEYNIIEEDKNMYSQQSTNISAKQDMNIKAKQDVNIHTDAGITTIKGSIIRLN